MYFTKAKLTDSQLEMMIFTIQCEYNYTNDDELAALISKNYDISLTDIVATLKAYRAYKNEDYEKQSEKVLMYGRC